MFRNSHKAPLIALAILGSLAFAVVQKTSAGTINFTVTHPTQYVDNSPLPVSEITQSRIEYGSCSGGAFGTKLGETVITGTGTTKAVTSLAAGTYCSRAYTTAKGLESAPSNVVVSIIPQAGPNPPTLSATSTVAMTVKKTSYGWAMNDNVGVARLGAPCDENQSFGNGYYALKDPKHDVTYYHGQRVRKVIAVVCGAT